MRDRLNHDKAKVEEYLVLEVQTPTLNFSKQNFRKSSQWGLLKTERTYKQVRKPL